MVSHDIILLAAGWAESSSGEEGDAQAVFQAGDKFGTPEMEA